MNIDMSPEGRLRTAFKYLKTIYYKAYLTNAINILATGKYKLCDFGFTQESFDGMIHTSARESATRNLGSLASGTKDPIRTIRDLRQDIENGNFTLEEKKVFEEKIVLYEKGV